MVVFPARSREFGVMACSKPYVEVTKEVLDSVKKVLDKSSIKIIRSIKLQLKNNKFEDKILVLTSWRLYLLAAKVPTKVDLTFNVLEIRSISTSAENQVDLTFNVLEIRSISTSAENQVVIETEKSTYCLRFQPLDDVDYVISHVNFALSKIFHSSTFAMWIRSITLRTIENSTCWISVTWTAGGFSETYAALCDYNGIGCKEEVQWGSEVTEQVLHTLSKSSSLEEITLENSGLKSDFAQKLALALSENPVCVVHSLNLAHNQLDDKGVSSLVQQLCRSPKGLRLLNFSKTSITSRGFDSDLLTVIPALGQNKSLKHILLGKNFNLKSRKSKETLPSFKQFFSSAFSLNHISLSGVKLPTEALRALFQGLSSNAHLNDVHLDISACEDDITGQADSTRKETQTLRIRTFNYNTNKTTVARLPKQTGFDSDLLTVIPALGQNKSLRHILLGKNFNLKSRMLEDVLQKIVQLIQEEDCSLQSLSLMDSRLKSRTSILVNALGSNTCLRRVDLSGNSMEDIGAKMLAKALQINSTLRTVTWDRNGTSAQGLLDVARALDHNFTLQFMPVPLSDVTQAYRSAPERTEEALHKIQRSLLRNNQSQRFSQQQAFRLHQGIVTSTTEQVILESMSSLSQELCPLAVFQAESHNKILSSVSERVTVPRSVIKAALVERAGQDIQNKLDEVKLDVVTYLTNSIVDEILQELYSSHKKLDTIAIRKQTSRTRRIRPVSTFMMSLRAVPSSFSSLYCTVNYNPNTANPAHTDPEADGIEEVPQRKAQGGLVEAKPVQGILLPGMGLVGMGYPVKQKNDSEKTSEGKQTVRQEPVQTCFKPQPPPQSLKPSLASFRQTRVSETSVATFYLENETAQDGEDDMESAEEERERERGSEEEQRQTTNLPETNPQAPPLPPHPLTSSQKASNEKQVPPPVPSPTSKPVFQKRESETSASGAQRGGAAASGAQRGGAAASGAQRGGAAASGAQRGRSRRLRSPEGRSRRFRSPEGRSRCFRSPEGEEPPLTEPRGEEPPLPEPRGEEPPLSEPRGEEPSLPEPRGEEAKSIPPPQPRPPPLGSSPAPLRPFPHPLHLDTLPVFLDLPVLDLEPKSVQHWPQLCPWFPAPLSPITQTSLGCCQTSLSLPLFAASLPLVDWTSLHRFPGEDLCPLLHPPVPRPTLRSPLSNRWVPLLPVCVPYLAGPGRGQIHPQVRPWKRVKKDIHGLEAQDIPKGCAPVKPHRTRRTYSTENETAVTSPPCNQGTQKDTPAPQTRPPDRKPAVKAKPLMNCPLVIETGDDNQTERELQS
ncbi:UNVERIFIED_CONTAM: hypothetical protein FKN15_033921 [Acipenser sinensis]